VNGVSHTKELEQTSKCAGKGSYSNFVLAWKEVRQRTEEGNFYVGRRK
jgi:hypothetical protein